MNVKIFASFGVGVVVGAVGGIFAMRKFYLKKIDDLMEMADEFTDDINCSDSDNVGEGENNKEDQNNADDEEPGNSEKNNEDNSNSVGGGRDTVDLNKIRDKININWERTSNYASMYDSPEPEDVDADEDYSSEAQTREEIEEEDMFDEYQNNRGRKPKIISLNDFSSLPASVDNSLLYYYRYDGVLVDENEEVIDDPPRLIGDSLTKYGWDESEEEHMYVINYDMNTAFEVIKVEGAFMFPDV